MCIRDSDETIEKNLLIRHAPDRNVDCRCLGATLPKMSFGYSIQHLGSFLPPTFVESAVNYELANPPSQAAPGGYDDVRARGSMLLESGVWRNTASCREADPTIFFPIGSTGRALRQIAAAKAVCMDCSVKELCLEFALKTNQDSGVWGGASEEERRQLRRERNRARRSFN